MMAADSNLITLLLFLLTGGGGGDLVECIPVDTYWQVKDVKPDTPTLLAELTTAETPDVSAEIEDLGSPDAGVRDAAAQKILAAGTGVLPQLRKAAAAEDIELEASRRLRVLITQVIVDSKPREVRRLMAIRTLGQRKEKGALATLQDLSASEEPFIAEYASRAIARIEGAPLPETKGLTETMKADLQLLLAGCAIVGQVRGMPELTPSFEQAVLDLKLKPNQRQWRLEMVTHMLVDYAERLGNLRVDGMTFGLSGDLSERGGFAVAILRGQYDPDLAVVAARQARLPFLDVNGADVYQWGPEGAFFIHSPSQLIFMASHDPADLPSAAMVEAIKSGKGTLANEKSLMALLENVDRTSAIWAAGQPVAAMKEAAILRDFDSVALTGAVKGKALHLTISGRGADPQRVKAAADTARQFVRDLAPTLNEVVLWMPPLQPMADAVLGFRIETKDNTATATTTYQGSITSLYLFSLAPFTLPTVVEE